MMRWSEVFELRIFMLSSSLNVLSLSTILPDNKPECDAENLRAVRVVFAQNSIAHQRLGSDVDGSRWSEYDLNNSPPSLCIQYDSFV